MKIENQQLGNTRVHKLMGGGEEGLRVLLIGVLEES